MEFSPSEAPRPQWAKLPGLNLPEVLSVRCSSVFQLASQAYIPELPAVLAIVVAQNSPQVARV
ncbi:MAG: hypothetical protein KME08_18260 [Aphanothece sp. CMT-3BRIN-NPC111]|nr:hypothetical protein [Aphanothece sp. CMT-3BRIN-NPC111]